MHSSEFKAWFEGFTEAIPGVPTKAQWARIKARVKEIDGTYTPYRVFYDRYWYPQYGPQWSYTSVGTVVSSPTISVSSFNVSNPDNNAVASCFNALGAADAQALTVTNVS